MGESMNEWAEKTGLYRRLYMATVSLRYPARDRLHGFPNYDIQGPIREIAMRIVAELAEDHGPPPPHQMHVSVAGDVSFEPTK